MTKDPGDKVVLGFEDVLTHFDEMKLLCINFEQ